MSDTNKILQKCHDRLKGCYGDDLAGVVLYGSVARGEDEEESDIDLLVLLKSEFDRWQEIKRMVRILFPLQMECDRYISAKPVAESDFRKGKVAFLRKAKSEGVAL
jgi:predicted nucleotidyltransferase